MSDLNEQVNLWLEPLDGESCGEDLEYDNAFLELSKAAEGKPETQFSEAESADWVQVAELAGSLLDRTRDLRVCMFWGRAQLQREGLLALPEVLRLIRGLLDRYWDDVHPRPDPDDGDPYARLNLLSQWEDASLALGDLRQSLVFRSRSIGQLSVRDVELALERLPPRDGESVLSLSSVEQMLQAAVEELPELRDVAARASQELAGLLDLLEEKAGYGRAPSCDDLKAILTGIQGLVPGESSDANDDLDAMLSGLDEESGAAVAKSSSRSRGAAGLGDRIETRADAVRAIEMICQYLDEAEPTSPAQLLLRRAQRLIDKGFMDLIRELAPDALSEIAKIMGVDLEEGRGDSDDD